MNHIIPAYRSPGSSKSFGKYLLSYLVYFLFIFWLATGFDHPGGLTYILICSFLSIASAIVVVNPWNTDLFEPIKVAAAFYGLSFGIAPLLLGPEGVYEIWYIKPQVSKVLTSGAYLALTGFLCMIVAYYLVPAYRRRSTLAALNQPRTATRGFIAGGCIVLLIGIASYLILVKSSGGVGHFLTYSGGRSTIFQTAFGGYFWGTFFLISGLSAIGAAIVSRHPWYVLLLGVVLGALFALFQGRAAAIAPIFVSIVLIHYGYRKLSLRVLAASAFALMFAASMMGAYRAAEKSMINRDIAGFVAEFTSRTRDNLLGTLAEDIERLDMLLVCYKYVENEGEPLGAPILLAWLGPINRHVFGGSLSSTSAGQFLFGLLNPHARDLQTGRLPSLPGELYLSFGLWGLIVGQLLYGALLKQISSLTKHRPIRTFALAIYPFLTIITSYLVITGTVQLFNLLTVLTGIFVAAALSGFRTDRSVAGPERRVDPGIRYRQPQKATEKPGKS